MKNFLLSFFISFSAAANTFSLIDSGVRFTLSITPKELSYSSEGLQKSILLSHCNESLMSDLNGEIISKLPSTLGKEGLHFKVDQKNFKIDPKSELGNMIMLMDARILRFIYEENLICKKSKKI